ncbi:MAG: type I DNA topoisomerase [Anaerolineaceae bacterium]|nr:type I DNA topoisomerase [Anaerolineaceae bacterium]
MEAYCVKCKEKRKLSDPDAGFNARANPITKGVCSICGTKMVRMGRTPAHENLTPPVVRKEIKRKGKLVIVESPAKARTVGRFLGNEFTVKASIGHVRDLLRSSLSVDIENNFQPKYRVPNEKREIVKELKKVAKHAEEVLLATDPDREGEAIAWHLVEAIDIDPELCRRVVFHEITQTAIEEAFENPRALNLDLVDAQQARRVLDRLVGYSISPILWEKVRGRLSAGRVQSVALRMIVERERAIDDFIPKEYWTIEAELLPEGGKTSYTTRLIRIGGNEPELPDEKTTRQVCDDLEKAKFKVSQVKKGTRRRKPAAPYITSTLQQEASRRLGFTAKRTMRVAQQLYEGIEVGRNGNMGLITYMRTDSTSVSDSAKKEVRQYILDTYGKDYLPEAPLKYRTRTKGAQEAHEAIRPTSVMRIPTEIKDNLTRDQYRMYQLIWKRFVASQMESAIFSTIVVDVDAISQSQTYLLRASGSLLEFQGFLVLYEETKSESEEKDQTEQVKIPEDVKKGQIQELVRLISAQHFTQPPPRFSEASLVQSMEEFGIGRPSTYAPILSTIQTRGYVTREGRRLMPTEIGFIVNDLLVGFFPNVVDVHFTAAMEQDLDQIAGGKRVWTDVVGCFYETFSPQVEKAQKEMPIRKTEDEKIGRECPRCGHDLIIRWGRFGKFISCSNFPECRYTEPWLEKIGIECPNCNTGEIVRRRSRKGRVFYGCSNYPECDFTSWKEPVNIKCPTCGGLLVKVNKHKVQCLKCEEIMDLDEIVDDQRESA